MRNFFLKFLNLALYEAIGRFFIRCMAIINIFTKGSHALNLVLFYCRKKFW